MARYISEKVTYNEIRNPASAETDILYCPRRPRKAAAAGKGLPGPSRAVKIIVSVLEGRVNSEFKKRIIKIGQIEDEL